MIIWLTGNSGSGKTTLANIIASYYDVIILDGDEMRESISIDLGLSKEDREEHNLRVARLALNLSKQGKIVIVSLICPYESLREKVKEITNCIFVYIPGGVEHVDYPYEIPINTFDFVYNRKSNVLIGIKPSLATDFSI